MAKLYEYGEGLLRTHVTWEDIQLKVKEIWGEEAIFGENKSAESIGDGRGFMSKMCLITPDWKKNLSGLPTKFVVKISSQIAFTEAGELMKTKLQVTPEMEEMTKRLTEAMTSGVRQLHNTEANVYSLIDQHNIDLPHPKIFGKMLYTEENQVKGFLIMEYIEGALNLNLYDNISVEDLKKVFRGIASLEAASLRFSEEEKASLEYNPFKDLMKAILNPTTMQQTIVGLKHFAGHVLGEKIDVFEQIFHEMLDLDIFTLLGPRLGMQPVLVHGDLWASNMLWKKKEGDGEGLHLAAIIDFQTASFSMPGSDLFRAMAACLSGKDRQEHWEELTEYFYDRLVEHLNGLPAPYNLEQLKENYRQFVPMGGCTLVPMIGPVREALQANRDPEAKQKVEDLVMEKMGALLDDMLFYHQRNMDLKKNSHESK